MTDPKIDGIYLSEDEVDMALDMGLGDFIDFDEDNCLCDCADCAE